MTRKWPAPAKINLFLYINDRRSDGYHLLQTLLQFLDYSDQLTITPTADGKIRLLTTIDGVSHEDNLIVRAAQRLQHYCWVDDTAEQLPGAEIILEKIIPIGGGLGGGSSNAATVLIALNKQWQCGFSTDQLVQFGLELGADIPFFIHGQAAFAEGIGEVLTTTSPPEKWYLIAIPPVSIATKTIFNDPQLHRYSSPRPLWQLLAAPFHNDCEALVRKHFAVVEQHISWLLKYAPSRLTGTGACVFAEFDTEVAARHVLSLAPTWLRCFVARGLNVSPLHRAL